MHFYWKSTCTGIRNILGKYRMETHSDILLFFLSWCIANMTPPRTTAIINMTIITIAGTSAGELRAGMREKIVFNNCVKFHAYCIGTWIQTVNVAYWKYLSVIKFILQWWCSCKRSQPTSVCHHSNHKEGIDIFDVTGSDDDIKDKCNLLLLSELEIGLASGLNMMLCYVRCRHTFSEYNCVSRPSQLLHTKKLTF